MARYIRNNFQSTVNEKKRKKRSVIRRGGELEIWNMYKQGSQFIIPYYISDSIGTYFVTS